MNYLKIFSTVVLLTGINISMAQTAGPFSKGTTIYIVRHAEKLSGKDPLLTEAGNTRAGDLMRTLKDKKVDRIYVTEYKRTQNTADSLRIQLDIDTVQINADTTCSSLFTAISSKNDWSKKILIVTHSNIIPKIIYKLGITSFPQENIPDTEFDNLYIISIKNKKPVLGHVKYGKSSAASAAMQKMQ
ncbi:MAG: phosphoglycerate mutase family protein [Ferruginibacter sp.]